MSIDFVAIEELIRQNYHTADDEQLEKLFEELRGIIEDCTIPLADAVACIATFEEDTQNTPLLPCTFDVLRQERIIRTRSEA